MYQSDFCLFMFLFHITWYFKIFCLKAYKFLTKQNGIYFAHECLFTLSPSLSVNGKLFLKAEIWLLGEYFVFMLLAASNHKIYVIN